MVKLIIDTDPGNGIPGSDIDDALAIGVALLSPVVELLGLTTVAANVELADANRCALALLDAAGRADVPVCAGAERPLLADPGPIRRRMAERRQGEDVRRLWAGTGLPAPTRRPDPRPAVELIVEAVRANPGEVTLVPIGPLTNVATALAADPRLATSVREIVWMGGAVGVPGMVTPVTELNAAYDPEAVRVVFQSGAPITMVGLDVTTRTTLTLDDVAAIRAVGAPLATYLADISDPWVRYVGERRGLPGCYLHDPLAVCAALDRSIVRTEPMHVDVELASPRYRGQTVGWGAQMAASAPGPPNADVCVEVDNARFMPMLLGTLGAATAQTGSN